MGRCYDRPTGPQGFYLMFQRFFDEGLAQASYLVACNRTGEAIVVDPRRDADVYVAAARQHGLRIAAAVETHIHADFVSGARELAETGARTIAGPGASLGFDCHEIRDGERLAFGDLQLEFLHTPGHTPEHVSIVARQEGEPARVFTGDTLFVGAVGRPDLLGEEQMRQLAGELYDSLSRKLLKLDDEIEVHPGHGAGSLCGTGIGDEPHSTIGRERRFNPALQHGSREAFVASVLADLPETPPYFQWMKRINQEGPALLGLAAGYAGVTAIDARQAAAAVRESACLIDLRGADAFCAEHPAGALNLGYGPRVGYWAGWVVPIDTRIVLLASNAGEASEAGRQLLRVGLDAVEGYIEGGLDAWRKAGLPASSIQQIGADAFSARLAHADGLTVIDVRTAREWQKGHIAGALHIPIGELAGRTGDVPRTGPVATICEGGYRSTLAASLLSRAGFIDVLTVQGGMGALRATGGQVMNHERR
jgi:hydroxyacylglutathione hydrolase